MIQRVERLTDKREIRRRLENDREWSLYALADLDEGMFEHSDWWGCGEQAIALVFRAIAIRPIFVMGDGDSVFRLLQALPERRGYLNIKPDLMEVASRVYRYDSVHEMARMFIPNEIQHEDAAEELGPADCTDIENLFLTGGAGGTGFAPFQLKTGVFRGFRNNGELVAAGGVHVLSKSESAAGIGNIYTRPDHRGRGLAQKVTASVVAAVRTKNIQTIGLNVEISNAPAIRAYERVGFRRHFTYYEGIAQRLA
jgi:ribosomal protein S18 acetylase RimI-like enzyme